MNSVTGKIGFIGVGRMGANMARCLQDTGQMITAVFDTEHAASTSLAQELGCAIADNPAEVAAMAEIIFTVVSDDQAMRHIYNADSNADCLAHARGRLFINCATVSPGIHREIETLVEQYGAQSLEACMAGSIPQAREGQLYFMCAGRPEAYERAKPVLEPLSASHRYLGPSGQAATVKALVNMVMNMNTAALAEGLGLGEALGIDLGLLREVFAQTGAQSRVLETDGADMQTRNHECYFSITHAAKDSGIALDLAKEAGLNLPLAEATFKQYHRLVELGKGELDKSGVAELTFRKRQGRP